MPDSLGAASTGRWLVTTHRSQHIFDLDAWTYCRVPGAGRHVFPHDGIAVKINEVVTWPIVGRSFFVYLQDPQDGSLQHWRMSSTIRSIEQYAD